MLNDAMKFLRDICYIFSPLFLKRFIVISLFYQADVKCFQDDLYVSESTICFFFFELQGILFIKLFNYISFKFPKIKLFKFLFKIEIIIIFIFAF